MSAANIKISARVVFVPAGTVRRRRGSPDKLVLESRSLEDLFDPRSDHRLPGFGSEPERKRRTEYPVKMNFVRCLSLHAQQAIMWRGVMPAAQQCHIPHLVWPALGLFDDVMNVQIPRRPAS